MCCGYRLLFTKIAFPVLILALVLQILGVALPYWYQEEVNSVKIYGGLFLYCVKQNDCLSCMEYKGTLVRDSWWKATQAFEIIGMLLILAAVIVTMVAIFFMSEKIIKLAGWALSFTACAFIIIGVCIYGGEASGTFAEYSGAFAIVIIAGILCLACGVLGLLDWLGIKV